MKKVLIFGDSLVQGLEFEESFEYSYHVESYPGYLARDLGELLNISVSEEKYDIVVCCCGINDLGHGYTPEEVLQSLLVLHKIIKSKNANIVGVYLHQPTFSLFNELCSDKFDDDVTISTFFYGLEKGDLQSDNFHLTKQGKENFANVLQLDCENLTC
jgi:lysophospholipase L1-like esterase